jgi:hypothetical protein
MIFSRLLRLLVLLFFVISGTSFSAEAPLKQRSAFYPKERLAQIRANVSKTPWATQLRDSIVANARPWMNISDEELWDLMFGATISRTWMVWSNGHCPACKKPVEMYTWKMEAWKFPWKTRCPHCDELFPKNDFYAFYLSGLDEHGVFDPKKGNRALLFNIEHPDPKDPLHLFGVDDGEGYVEGTNRWRFIGAYLIFGQFHQRVLSGIDTLTAAYVLTGNPIYAHKAGILLDRVADLYPTFDFLQQGYVYEVKQAAGYVSVWHDTSEETYEMVLAYDQIFEGLRDDKSLLEFLSTRAKKFQLTNPKQTFEDVQRNIEGRILRDALAHPEKIHSNFPRKECTEAAIHTVLGWPENREQVEKMMDVFIKQATAVDGVTGEKGLAGYTAYTIAAMARFLNEYARVDPTFLASVMKRNPGLRQTYRFHIDTHCLDKYYPAIGDTVSFAQRMEQNPIMIYSQFHPGAPLRAPLAPSMYSFYWQLYQETGDPAYVQTLYAHNNHSLTNLPYDIFENDPKTVQRNIAKTISKFGVTPTIGSIDKKQWHLAILRSGSKENARAAWLDYDSGGAHGHHDGMNLGLYAHGLDLLPDFGYPPVQFGGWTTPRANWYKMSAAHNTVVVDGQDHRDAAGKTTLWADGKFFQASRASAPGLIGGKQFERTVGLIDVSERDFYVVDIFRVVGGSDHARFAHGHFAQLSTDGLTPQKTAEFGNGTQTRKFQVDENPRPGWSVTWNVEDKLNLLPKGQRAAMRYTDLTSDASAWIGEAWIVPGIYKGTDGVWNPCVITRRHGTAPLASTFAGVYEPYGKTNFIAQIRRLPLFTSEGEKFGDAHVAIEIVLKDGHRDLLIAADIENPLQAAPSLSSNHLLVQPDWNVRLEGELCWLRKSAKNKIERIAFARASSLKIGEQTFRPEKNADFTELKLAGQKYISASSDK